jgi:biotin transporter BioY
MHLPCVTFNAERGEFAEMNAITKNEEWEYRMKPNAILVVTSLLSILLLTLHISDDIVRGISKAEPANIALLVLAAFLYGTLVLAERRSGHVIMLLVGLFAAGMPVIHMRGAHYGEIAKSTGGFFFVWTLWALGGLGGFTFILSARGLWSLRRGQPRQSIVLPIHIAAGGLAIVLGAVPLSVKKGGENPAETQITLHYKGNRA